MALPFPQIDPVALAVGPFQIHWYALAYVAGFILAWRLARIICAKDGPDHRPNPVDIDDYISWAILGVLLGGRMGYILFYNLPVYLDHPLEAIKVWHGGMSFHGGAIGVIASLLLFSKIKKVPLMRLADVASAVAPLGFFLGRVANFINGELYGRVTDVAWGVVFPRGGPEPRHPSQIYEAISEGLFLFAICFALIQFSAMRNRPGLVSAAFLFFYGLFRFTCEFFREPDVQLGFILDQVTMGQILCLPMMVAGVVIFIMSWKRSCRTLAAS